MEPLPGEHRRWRDLVTVMVHPRETMTRVLEQPRDRMIVPILLLAIVSSLARETYRADLERITGTQTMALVALGMLVGACVLVGIFFLFAALTLGAGRILEGEGTYRRLVSAVAWGTTPLVWALLYRVPLAIYRRGAGEALQLKVSSGDVQISNPLFEEGCGMRLLFGTLDAVTWIWMIIVMSATIAVAHRFSNGQGCGALALALLSPLIIGVIVVLSAI